MPKLLFTKQPIRLRWILLLLYVAVGGAFLGKCFLHMGHSTYCEYALYSLLPAGLVAAALLYALVPWSMIPDGSLRMGIEIIILPVPFVATCVQYYLIGWLLDKLVAYRKRKSK